MQARYLDCPESGGARRWSVFGEMRFANVVQYFRKAAVVAGLVQKMRGTEGDGRILVFGQVVVRQDDDSRLQLSRGQRAHDAEARALLQMQIENDDIDRIALGGGDSRSFGVRGSDQLHLRDLANSFSQSLRQYLGVFDQ